jgi:hypothetical protein
MHLPTEEKEQRPELPALRVLRIGGESSTEALAVRSRNRAVSLRSHC